MIPSFPTSTRSSYLRHTLHPLSHTYSHSYIPPFTFIHLQSFYHQNFRFTFSLRIGISVSILFSKYLLNVLALLKGQDFVEYKCTSYYYFNSLNIFQLPNLFRCAKLEQNSLCPFSGVARHLRSWVWLKTCIWQNKIFLPVESSEMRLNITVVHINQSMILLISV